MPIFSTIRAFGDPVLENTFKLQQLKRNRDHLLYFLCVLIGGLLTLAISHIPNLDFTLFLAVLSTCGGLSLQLTLLLKNETPTSTNSNLTTTTTKDSLAFDKSPTTISFQKQQQTITVLVAVWMVLTLVGMWPAGSQYSLVPTVIVYISFYTIFPFQLGVLVVVGGLLGACQTFIFIWSVSNRSTSLTQYLTLKIQNSLSASTHFSNHEDTFLSGLSLEHIIATALIHIWANLIGIYMYTVKMRIARASFLNARSALATQIQSQEENKRMNKLLSGALPTHIFSIVKQSLGGSTTPNIYIQSYPDATVLFGRFVGLEGVLGQISVQDAGRLLNELDGRINMLVQRNNCFRVVSDGILICSGIPPPHAPTGCSPLFEKAPARWAARFGTELSIMVKSFCDSTTADLSFQIGIATGSVSGGINGLKKWHYGVIGPAVDRAIDLSKQAESGSILFAEETALKIVDEFPLEKVDQLKAYRLLLPSIISTLTTTNNLPPNVLFPNQRRLSLVTVPQAINRLLNSLQSPTSQDTFIAKGRGAIQRVRKKKMETTLKDKTALQQPTHLTLISTQNTPPDTDLMSPITLKFVDPTTECHYHAELDRWFISALTISILFLTIYGTYHLLTIQTFLPTLSLTVLALGVMFVMLLMLYANYFASFSQFITQTCLGHSTAILLVLVVVLTCGMVDVFTCQEGATCPDPHYQAGSVVLWMLTGSVFVKYSSLMLVGTLLGGVGVHGVHGFVKGVDFFEVILVQSGGGLNVDLVNGLSVLAFILYLQARRNERLIRIDYLSGIRILDERQLLERYENSNEQIVVNFLPAHIAQNYLVRSEPYCHLHHSVGIIYIKIKPHNDQQIWHSEEGFKLLNQIIVDIDQISEHYPGLEKVKSAHNVYIAAVGVLPEMNQNIHDQPYTIGDLLASLTEFALHIRTHILNDYGIQLRIGMDCGSAISLVLGGERPCYEVVGKPILHSMFLANESEKHGGLIVSEEIYLALRPRQFIFADDFPIAVTVVTGTKQNGEHDVYYSVPPGSTMTSKKHPISTLINGYVFEADRKMMEQLNQVFADYDETVGSDLIKEEFLYGHESPEGELRRISRNVNPMDALSSMNTSFSSEVASIDIDVESDSELEWYSPLYKGQNQLHSKPNLPSTQNVPSPAPKEANLLRKASESNSVRSNLPLNRHLSVNKEKSKSNRALVYSDFSESENLLPSIGLSCERRNKRMSVSRNGPKLPGWLMASKHSINNGSSELSLNRGNKCQEVSRNGSMSALDRLNATARRVDNMLKELAGVDDLEIGDNSRYEDVEVSKFPLNYASSVGGGSVRSGLYRMGRALSSTCQTDYDNMESENNSDHDLDPATSSKLEELKLALKGGLGDSHISSTNRRTKRSKRGLFGFGSFGKRCGDTGDEADGEESNCSSLAASQIFDSVRWKSVHSIGYENEYEFSNNKYNYFDDRFEYIDDEADQSLSHLPTTNEPPKNNFDALKEMSKLAKDIQQNFGDYQLASFEDNKKA